MIVTVVSNPMLLSFLATYVNAIGNGTSTALFNTLSIPDEIRELIGELKLYIESVIVEVCGIASSKFIMFIIFNVKPV